MKKRSLLFAAFAAVLLSACSGLKDALTAHTDRVASAEDAELLVPRLATLVGNSRAPIRKDIAKSIASVWVDYQLLGQAAAHGDSLNDPKSIDEAMWPAIANLKASKWYAQVSKGWGIADTAAAQRNYASGEVLAADHILLFTQGLTPAGKVAVKRQVDSLRAIVTPENFSAIATARSQDQGSAVQGGSLGLFQKGAMVPAFERGLLALRPGQISPPIETQYGYHIIRRPAYDQMRDQLLQASKGRTMVVAESTYLAKLEADGKIEIKKEAIPTLRAIGNDPDKYRDDNTVVATFTAGKLTTSRLIGWLETLPPNARILDQIKQAPDSVLTTLIRNFVKNELVLKQADSAKIQIDTAQVAQLRRNFVGAVTKAWSDLGVSPASLRETASSEGDRERLAATRIDDYFTKMVAEQAAFVAVPTPIANALRKKYDYSFSEAGFDRAVEEATKVRTTVDSATRTGQPPTVVPLTPAPSPAPSTPGGQ